MTEILTFTNCNCDGYCSILRFHYKKNYVVCILACGFCNGLHADISLMMVLSLEKTYTVIVEASDIVNQNDI